MTSVKRRRKADELFSNEYLHRKRVTASYGVLMIIRLNDEKMKSKVRKSSFPNFTFIIFDCRNLMN